MSKRRISRKDLLAATDFVGPGDGLDPRLDRPEGERQLGRKTLQLCGQVMETLNGLLAEQADDVLRDLQVLRVSPIGGGRLLVVVALALSAATHEPDVLAERLASAQGRLRTEVASAIQRRKAPELVYQIAR